MTDSQPNDNDFFDNGDDVEDDDADLLSTSFDAVASAAAWAHSFSNQLAYDWSKKLKPKLRVFHSSSSSSSS